MKKTIDTRTNGKLISDLPASTSPQSSDVFEGQNLTSGSYKITFQDLSKEISKKVSIPVATSQVVGGIKGSSGDKKVNVIADGTAIVNNVPSITEMNASLSNKVDVVPGKQLSQEDFTGALKAKLDGIAAGAQVNVISAISLNGQDVQPVNGKVNLVFSGGGGSSDQKVQIVTTVPTTTTLPDGCIAVRVAP